LVGVYYLYGWYYLQNSCFQNSKERRKEARGAELLPQHGELHSVARKHGGDVKILGKMVFSLLQSISKQQLLEVIDQISVET